MLGAVDPGIGKSKVGKVTSGILAENSAGSRVQTPGIWEVNGDSKVFHTAKSDKPHRVPEATEIQFW